MYNIQNEIKKQCVYFSYSTYLPGLQSVKREQIDSKTFDIVKAGDQLSLSMSKQITP